MVDQAEPRISDLKLQEQALADQVEEHESVYRNAAKAIEPMTEAHRMLGDEIQSLERHLKDMVDLATSEQERLAQLAKSASPSLTLPSSTVKAPAIGDIPNFFDPEQQQRMDEATAQMQKSMDKIKGAFSDVNGALSPLTSNFGGLNANLATITNVANGALAAFVAFQGITFVAPLIAGITAAIAGGGGLAAVLVALGGPITIVAALVAGLAFAWVTDFGGIRATTEDLVTSLATWVDETVLPKLADISTFIDKTLRPAFESFASFVLTEVVPRVGAFMSALGQLKDLILTEVVPRIGNLLSILGEFKDFIGIYVLPIVEKLNEIGLAALTRVLSEVAGWFQKAGDAAAGNAGFTSMLDQLNKGLQGTHDLLASLGDIAHTVFENIRTWASENLLPWLKTLADTLDAVKVFVNGPGASSPPIAHNALGTPYFGGGLSIVGEQGPELVTLPRGVAITPMSQMGGAGAEKAAPQVNTTVHVGVSVGNNRELADLIAHENTEAFAEALAAGW
jgi:prefoldin subunit 5